MLAFGLTIGLFLYWGVVGCAVVRSLRTRMPPLQEMLFAPAVGAVLTVVPLFILNRWGAPVGRFGYPLTIVLLVGAGCLSVLAWRPRPFADLPWRDYAPFAGAILLALLLTGRPMLEFGFDWVSFCNDDMANYCLGALRFYHHGFAEPPQIAELMRGTDYSQFYWFFYVPGMGRTGSELLIAWVMRLTGLSPHQVFMPLILAFHLCQVSAAGALVCQSRKMKSAALAACLLTACSALASFGALYQLNSQVIGLAVLAGAAATLLRPYGTRAIDADAPLPSDSDAQRPGLLVRQGLLVGILMSGLFVLYPEVLPMIGLAWVIYVAVQLTRRKVNPRAVLTIVGIAAATGVVLLWRHVRVVFVFILGQATAGATGSDVQNVFYPFYLLPSGLADLWGFFPLTRVASEPLASIAILAGALLLAAAVVMAAWLASREQPVGVITGVMLALGLFLFLQHASFGMYKLAMFLQPFLLGTVALAWLTLVQRRDPSSEPAPSQNPVRNDRLRRYGPLVLLALPGLFIQQGYVQASRGRGQGTGFGELADPSASRISADFRRLLASHGVPDGLHARPSNAGTTAAATAAPPGGLVVDSYNIVLSKFQAAYTRGTSAAFPSTQLGTGVMPFDPSRTQAPKPAVQLAMDMYERITGSFPKYRFDLRDPDRPDAFNRFVYRTLGPDIPATTTSAPGSSTRQIQSVEPLFIGAGGKQSVINRWHGRAPEENFFAAPLSRVRDHLLFTESAMGRGYYLSPRDIALYQLEPDPKFMVGTTMSAAGRHVLFEVVNPSPTLRMVLELTTSLRADGDNALPPAAVVGAARAAFPVVGRGSARVFSPPLAVQTIGGHAFIAIDLGRDAAPFPMYRTGLMRAYGSGVTLDWRTLVAFARDISVVSERQYAAIKPPSRLEAFPKDLQNNQLEYSGMYEDGWVSDRAWLGLAQPWDAGAITIKGNVPDLGDKKFETEMTVLIDGIEVTKKVLGANYFEMSAPLPTTLPPQANGRRRVDLRFTKYQNLGLPDGRPVTFQIGFLGFEGAPSAPVAVSGFPGDLFKPLLDPVGVDGDGWAAQKVSMRLTQPPDRPQLVVRGMVPNVGGRGAGGEGFKTTVRVLVDGKPAAEQALGLDHFEVRAAVPAPATPEPRRVELEFSNVQRLPAPDARTVACQLSFLGFEPPPAPPRRIERFPDDLRNPLVEASGVDEDGWVGATGSLRLVQPPGDEEITVRGMVPQVGDAGESFQTELRVLVDGKEVGRQTVTPGPFEVRVGVAPADAAPDAGVARRVELRFSATQRLPAPDGRTVGGRLTTVGFTSPRDP